ncbi:NAD(P)-binding protein [Thelephora ganbajun]|uniref:NAD(P)-binding protein n=1 Tax=Thelephora ganbajun TaxID=370292 RepID=A0ACB6ZW60_THEGA|nr:NAD(P)-binding protein [Thelephora ganbajun]
MDFFALLGTVISLYYLLKLADFVWFYFLRPSDGYKKYQRGPQSYALITGSTDGIGKSLAKDLYRKGFNVIVHGRDEKKLKATVDEIKALREDGIVESFIADVTSSSIDYADIAKRFDDLNITLLINNVGGTYLESKRFEEWSENDHLSVIRWNALFPTLLTRAFLPSLRKTSLSHPVLIVFNGSFSAEFAIPRIPLYTASKAFVHRLPSSLSADERFIAGQSNIEFMYLHTGSVQSNTITEPADFSRPTSDDYAAHIVKAFGSGREEVVPYIGHRIGLTIIHSLPSFILRGALKGEANKLFIMEAKKSKKE